MRTLREKPARAEKIPRPLNLVAELSYRCPLRCPYCSNPLALDEFPDALSADDWARVFEQAAALGVVHVGLTGGEPSTRRDLPEIVEAAARAGLYSHLVSAGVPLDATMLAELKTRGLDSLQISFQDAEPARSDEIAGTKSFARKLRVCAAARALGLPLTLNVVLHRHNLARVPALVALARELGAERLELANAQYHGWALENRAALLPSRAQLDAASLGRHRRARRKRCAGNFVRAAGLFSRAPQTVHGRLGTPTHCCVTRRARVAVPRRGGASGA